jgi:hypothetical protein
LPDSDDAQIRTATAPRGRFPVERGALTGILHAYVAFDWGDEIRLDQAQQLVPAELHALSRRRRTPASIGYRPPPLRYPLPSPGFKLGDLDQSVVTAEATVFDFGGVSVALHVPFTRSPDELVKIAAALSDPRALIATARTAVESLFLKIAPAVDKPRFSELTEEYLVFQLTPGPPLPDPATLLAKHTDWLAALARLELEPLSSEERMVTTQAHLSYGPEDLFMAEWSAALLIDRDCEETLQVIEFANVQLLEFRYLDDLLDDRLEDAYRLIHRVARSWLPFWRLHNRALRSLGELKIDVHSIFERTGNVLKLVGDQYLARIYQLIGVRFHLGQWAQSIERSLSIVQSIYQVVSEQSATYRAEFLEILIIALIAFEIVMAIATT